MAMLKYVIAEIVERTFDFHCPYLVTVDANDFSRFFRNNLVPPGYAHGDGIVICLWNSTNYLCDPGNCTLVEARVEDEINGSFGFIANRETAQINDQRELQLHCDRQFCRHFDVCYGDKLLSRLFLRDCHLDQTGVQLSRLRDRQPVANFTATGC